MKRSLLTLVVAACLGVGAGGLSAQTVERIVAKVNGEIITLTEFESEVQSAFAQMSSAPNEERPERVDAVRRQILEGMIDNKLVLQVAAERGLRVPSRFFDEWKQSAMDEYELETEEDLARVVEAQGTYLEELRKRFEENLLIREVLRMEVESKVSVSEPEIEERYQQNIQEYTEPAKVRLREIVVRFDDTDEVQKGQKARRVLSELGQGRNFEELARLHSESGSREKGGDLGFWEEGELAGALARVAFALKEGEVSEIIRLDGAFYIIKVDEWVEAKTKRLEAVRNEVADSIFQEKLAEEMDRYIKRLREQAMVEMKL